MGLHKADGSTARSQSLLPLLVIFIAGVVVGVWLTQRDPQVIPALSALPTSEPQTVHEVAPSVAPPTDPLSFVAEAEAQTFAESEAVISAVPSASRETIAATDDAPPSLAALREQFVAARLAADRQEARRLLSQMLELDGYSGLTVVSNAEWLYTWGSKEAAIRRLLEHQAYERDQQLLQVIAKDLHDWLPKFLTALLRGLDRERQLAFLGYLTVQRPQVSRYRWELALLQFKLRDDDAATITLSTLLYDPVWGPKAVALQRRIDERLALLAEYDIRLPIERSGKHHVLPVRLNGIGRARLIIDTGATRTLLSPAAMARAGLGGSDEVGRVSVSTASDVVEAPLMRVGIELQGSGRDSYGNPAKREYTVIVYDSPLSNGIDGLLGMDVLGQYRFYIDQQQNFLYLRPQL